jgi:hypothetical protein
MNPFSYLLKTILVMLLLLIPVGWAGHDHGEPLFAAEYMSAGPPLPPRPVQPERPHTWGPDPGTVIYDGYYPPYIIYPPYQRHGSPHYYHPPYPPPYFVYPPPYYEPETPWYKDEMPIPAGRVVLLVDPLDAEVFVNGLPLGRNNDLSFEAGLLQGNYEVEVKADGYQTQRRKVEIRGGEIIRLTIRLDKKTGDD